MTHLLEVIKSPPLIAVSSSHTGLDSGPVCSLIGYVSGGLSSGSITNPASYNRGLSSLGRVDSE